VSIVLFEHKKWPYLFLHPCLIKSIEIYTEEFITYGLSVPLKSTFYLLLFSSSVQNKVAFSSFWCIFMMISHMLLFFLYCFPAENGKSKRSFIRLLIAFLMLHLFITLLLIQPSSFHRKLNFCQWFQQTSKQCPTFFWIYCEANHHFKSNYFTQKDSSLWALSIAENHKLLACPIFE
jgi:hypothetical protein